MSTTRASLIAQAAMGSRLAWDRLAGIYQPLIAEWLRQCRLGHHDAEDLTQDVLFTVSRHLPDFRPSGRTGAFRCWLRTITVNRARDFWKAPARRGDFDGSAGHLLDQLEDPNSEPSRRWDADHDRHVVQCLLCLVEPEFDARSVTAFRRVALHGEPAAEVAADLGMTVGAVYVARSRVLRRLRDNAAHLLD